MKKEESLQIAVSNYLRLQYPDVIFTSESSGLRLPIGLAKKAKAMRSGNKLPDLWILEPRNGNAGLLIELKSIDAKRNTPHNSQQAETILKLIDKGYHACFAFGFNDAKSIIDFYMKQEKNIK